MKDWGRGPIIGRGSFGTVHLARFSPAANSGEVSPEFMAVKSCPLSQSSSLLREKFFLEQFAGCPEIISCYGGAATSATYNLFLEYLPGGSLAELRRRRQLATEEIRRLAASLLCGIHQIHAAGVVHCDIKPQNLLLSSSGAIKIADFGLSKFSGEPEEPPRSTSSSSSSSSSPSSSVSPRASSSSSSSRVSFKSSSLSSSSRVSSSSSPPPSRVSTSGFSYLRGTPLYMAPESATKGEYEPPADIWALGCVVAEIAAGETPWRSSKATNVESLLFLLSSGDCSPEIPEELPEEGKDFLRRCFIRNPKKRWTAEMLLRHPFVESFFSVDKNQSSSPAASPKSVFDFPSEPEKKIPSGSFSGISDNQLPAISSAPAPARSLGDLAAGSILWPSWDSFEDTLWLVVREETRNLNHGIKDVDMIKKNPKMEPVKAHNRSGMVF